MTPAHLEACKLVLRWFARQEGMPEPRFKHLLADRAQAAADPHVRWVCANVLQVWSLRGPRAAYAGSWADGTGVAPPDAPWDQAPGP